MQAPEPTERRPLPSGRHAPVGHGASIILDSTQSWVVLSLLTLSYALAYVDRQMLNLLVDPVKASLHISDTEFSLIQGTAFVSAYLLATPIFGRLVDMTNRRNILVVGVCIWSVCTALCSTATSFWGLFFPRFGVGVSEACVLPIAWSLIGDYFSARREPRALSIFQIGTQLGSGFSLICSGAVIAFAAILSAHISSLDALRPWQMAFVVIGLPGLALAVILLLVVREPPRRQSLAKEVVDRHPAIREVGRFFWASRNFHGRLYLAIGMIAIFNLGIAAWFPSFLIRAYGMPASTTGYRFGLLSVLVGSTGVIAGPVIAQRLVNREWVDTPIQIAAFATIPMFLACAALPFASTGNVALSIAGVAMFFGALPLALVSSAITFATPGRMRGVGGALYTLATQFLGYGVGPSLIALFTDRVFHDPKMVGFSLQIVVCSAIFVAMIMLFSIVPLHRRMLGAAIDTATERAPV